MHHWSHICLFHHDMSHAHPGPASPNTGRAELSRDAEFYFSDGNLVLQAYDTLFKASKLYRWWKLTNVTQVYASRLMNESNVLRDLLDVKIGQVGEGTSDDNPIIMPDTADDLRCLFKFIYTP